jgi:hypothetical protein
MPSRRSTLLFLGLAGPVFFCLLVVGTALAAKPIKAGGITFEVFARKDASGSLTATVKATSDEPRCLNKARTWGEEGPVLSPLLEFGPLTEAAPIGVGGAPEPLFDPTYGALRGTFWAIPPKNPFRLISKDEHSPWVWQATWPGSLSLSAREWVMPIGVSQPKPLGTLFPFTVGEAVTFSSGGNRSNRDALWLAPENGHYMEGGRRVTVHCPAVRYLRFVRPL